MGQGRFLEACPKLVQARQLEPHAGGTALALALCHEGEQKLATALRELRDALQMAQASGNKERIALATEHIAALSEHVSTRVLSVSDRAVRLTLDGASVDPG